MLSKKLTGLPKDSVANVSQVVTVDRSFLADCSGSLPASTMKLIDDGLRLVLSL
jgi:mRNA interferase MazF